MTTRPASGKGRHGLADDHVAGWNDRRGHHHLAGWNQARLRVGRIETPRYLRSTFPGSNSGPNSRWPISNGGGVEARWSRDGRRIVYRAGDQLMSVAYTVKGDAFVADAPKVWIERLGAVEDVEWAAVWDLAPDGERVIVVTPMESSEAPQPERHVVILQNFFDELRRRAPLPK